MLKGKASDVQFLQATTETLVFIPSCESVCHRDTIATVQNAVTKLYRCVVEIKMKVLDVVRALLVTV